MTDEKWENLIFAIEEKFGITKRVKDKIEIAKTIGGESVFGERETIEFLSPKGKMKIERVAKPKILDKKVLSTKRIGGKTAIDYIYSQEEKTYEIKLYQFEEKENNWREIDFTTLGY
ncbi:MAG: hypothetical protein N2259_01750 [Patescibacteria group bacterium]|nr:hypothetical protein [Patescibacteria group bacterium]